MMHRGILPVTLACLLSWTGLAGAEPLRLAVLGMPLEDLEEELAPPPPPPADLPPLSAPAPSAEPSPPLETAPAHSSTPPPEPTAPLVKEPPSVEGGTENESPEKAENGTPPAEEDMALFRILDGGRHEFFLSSLGLPLYGNQQRLDPDLCLAVVWDSAARWQSRLCYRAVYAELQEQNAVTGELMGVFNLQRADGHLDLVDFIYEWKPDWLLALGWTVSRYLLDFNRTGRALELGGERFDHRSTAVWLSSGIQAGLYHRTRAGSVLRLRLGVEPFTRLDLEQEYFLSNQVASRATFQQGSGTIYTLAASLTRRLGQRLEGMVDLRYRRLPLSYQTRLSAVTDAGEIQLVDRFRGSDSLLRSGARLTLHLPRASVSPYLEGAMYYLSNKDELDREYIYYSGWRLFVGLSRFF